MSKADPSTTFRDDAPKPLPGAGTPDGDKLARASLAFDAGNFALVRLAGVIEKLVVYPENMRKNLDRLGGIA